MKTLSNLKSSFAKNKILEIATLLLFGFVAQAQTKKTLNLYFTNGKDNFTTATTSGAEWALGTNYTFVRVEGYVLNSPVSGTVPLKSYWSAARGDSFTTATDIGVQSALGAGYQFARIEGYVYREQIAGTVPLKLYWSDAREDNFTTATEIGARSAVGAGYRFVSIEGYVFP